LKASASTQNDDIDANNWRRYIARMTPGQCRAARAFLQISQPELATAASVGVSTVRDFEAGRRDPMLNNLKAIQAELERQGVRFLDRDDSGTCGVLYAEPEKGAA
jgi:DNA-binding transcriptional regulator YiaG